MTEEEQLAPEVLDEQRDAMKALFSEGIMDPNPDIEDGCDPRTVMTRGELAMILARLGTQTQKGSHSL